MLPENVLFRGFADLVLVIHFGFIVFVLLGGFLVFRWRWVFWFHVSAVLWAVLLEFGGWMCPLTYLENWLRLSGGEANVSGGVIEPYLLPLVYPGNLTPLMQAQLGSIVAALNLGIYGLLFFYIRRIR